MNKQKGFIVADGTFVETAGLVPAPGKIRRQYERHARPFGKTQTPVEEQALFSLITPDLQWFFCRRVKYKLALKPAVFPKQYAWSAVTQDIALNTNLHYQIIRKKQGFVSYRHRVEFRFYFEGVEVETVELAGIDKSLIDAKIKCEVNYQRECCK